MTSTPPDHPMPSSSPAPPDRRQSEETFGDPIPQLLYLPADESEEVSATLEALAQRDERPGEAESGTSSVPRHAYPARAVVGFFPASLSDEIREPANVLLAAWSRNLSASDVSLLSSTVLLPFGGFSEQTPVLQLGRIAAAGCRCVCGLLKPPEGLLWIEGRVHRMPEAGDNMVELAIQFVRRADDFHIHDLATFERFLAELR